MITVEKKDVSKPKWTLIEEVCDGHIQALFDVYAKDKAKAKIYFHLNRGMFSVTRKVLFEYSNGDFKFVKIVRTYGISSTNKMYNNEKTMNSVMYKGGKFYVYDNTGKKSFIRNLTLSGLNMFVNMFGFSETILGYFTNRFGWVRNLEEDWLYSNISFDTIVNKKLYSTKALLRHVYNCPYPIAKIVHAYTITTRSPFKYVKVWNEIRKNLINVENLSDKLYLNSLFHDTCNMARMVGTKVNCSWSEKRLKAEHDKWSRIITEVLLENEPLIDLKISSIFEDFAKHSGFEILKTNHDLISEGKMMNHCVATYANKVNSGSCAIYRVDGHTLELGIGEDNIYIVQFRGYSNSVAPKELHDIVNASISTFKPVFSMDFFLQTDELPF